MDDLETLKPREQMLEIAFDFHTMCTHSMRSNLYCVHSVISGLSLEIILKSFNSEETQIVSDHISKYSYNRSKIIKENHNLISLLDNVPPKIKGYLFNERDIEIITEYQNVFSVERYRYEKGSRTTFDNSFIKLVGRTIFKMIELYKRQNSKDCFITYIDNETLEKYRNELYQL